MAKVAKTTRGNGRARALFLGLAVVGFLALVATGWYFFGGGTPKPSGEEKKVVALAEPPHPGRVLTSPFLNVKPDVAFVGDEACAGCHGKIVESYRTHPMGRSLASVSRAAKIEQFGEGFHSPFVSGPFTFRADLKGEAMIHGEILKDSDGRRVAELSREMSWVVGSGSRGRSYLIDHDGYLFQSPLAWYVETKSWDLSPQYEKANLHFSRPITSECLFCHCNQAEPIAGAINRYAKPVFHGEAIGCERCHGPGQLHTAHQTAQPTANQRDLTIANPGHMDHRTREDVCWQCHLQSAERVLRRGRKQFDYRPGLPLDAFLRDYIKTDADPGAPEFVGAVPQMLESRCYLASEGEKKLGCISCHDPHGLPAEAERETFYRHRCMACHERQPCNLPLDQRKAQKDSCIACHMPKAASKFPHLQITDHRVPRKAGLASTSAKPKGEYPLAALLGNQVADSDRDLAIALISQADKSAIPEAKKLAKLALPLLKPVCATDRNDAAALYAQAKAWWYLDQRAEALKSFEALLERFPNEENSLYNAAVLAAQSGAAAKAAAWSGQLVKLNPWRWEYYQIQAQALALVRDRAGADAATRAALKLHPAALLTMQPSGAAPSRKK